MLEISALLADESFQNWLSGSASSNESSRWGRWLSQSSENRQLYETALKVWQSGRYRSAPVEDLDPEWSRLQSRLGMAPEALPSQGVSVVTIPSYQERRLRSRGGWGRFGAVAFAAAVVFAAVVFYKQFRLSEEVPIPEALQFVSTEYGQRATINLPDGTKVILNANSTFKYPAVWTQTSLRQSQLQGEAYFDVAEGQKEFAVTTSDGLVKVLGTKFVVYERGAGTRVVVEEGHVQVKSRNSQQDPSPTDLEVLLKEGQMVDFIKDDQKMTPLSVDVRPYTTWWHRELILSRTSFKDVVQRLEETYGVEVMVLDTGLLQRTLSGSIENQNLVIVIDALANALRVRVERKGQVIIFGNP